MRKIVTALVAALGVVVLAASSANATVLGGGEVVGSVTLTNPGCIPVATAAPKPTTYTFNDVVLSGAFADDAGHSYTGAIDVSNVKGGTNGENTIMGAGTVNSATDQATFTGSDGKTHGTFYGTFQRVGSIVLVSLNAKGTVAGGATQPFHVTVAANFAPAAGQDGVSTPICSATFSGLFATV